MSASVVFDPNVTIDWQAVLNAAQAEQAQAQAQPKQPQGEPTLLERAVWLMEAAQGGRPWDDGEAAAVGRELWHQAGDLADAARRQKRDQIQAQVQNTYARVYWGYALRVKHGRGWRDVAERALGQSPTIKRHTLETDMSGLLAIAPDIQMQYVVWPSMYYVVGTALPVRDGQDNDTNEWHAEAQQNLLAFAEHQLLEGDEEDGYLTVKALQKLARKMADERLTEVPLMDDGDTDNAPDEQALLIGTLQGQVAALSQLVDSTVKTMVDLCAPDPDLYSRAFRQGNMIMVRKTRILGGQVQPDADAEQDEDSEDA